MDEGAVLIGIAGERLAIPSGQVSEIARVLPLTRVPHSPPSLLGLANLRGTILPVVSLALLLEQEMAAVSASSRIVVVNKETPVGFLVDDVAALVKTTDARLVDIDALLIRDFGGLMQRIAGRHSGGAIASAVSRKELRNELTLIGFELAGQEYALALNKVAEVMALPSDIALMPGMDSAMLGATAVRGSLVPLISLHILLGLPMPDLNRTKARVILTQIGAAKVGLVVDSLKAILRVEEDIIDPVPPVLLRGKGEARIEAICRVEGGRRLISILSPARLFDTETAARILADATQAASGVSTGQGKDNTTEQFVIFRLGNEHYGLPIAFVEEVVRCPDGLTRIPKAPPFLEGVMNLRGKIVPLIDQRQRFAITGEISARDRRVIVVSIDGLLTGFVVDAVSEILRIPVSELMPAPDLTPDDAQIFDRVATIERDGRMILLVDPKVLLAHAERDLLAAIAVETRERS